MEATEEDQQLLHFSDVRLCKQLANFNVRGNAAVSKDLVPDWPLIRFVDFASLRDVALQPSEIFTAWFVRSLQVLR